MAQGQDGSGRGRPGRPGKRLDASGSAAAAFGAELRERRESAGVVITELAALTGYSAQHISAVERAAAAPSEQFVRVCDSVLHAGGQLADMFTGLVREQTALRHDRLARRRGGVFAVQQVVESDEVDWDRLGAAVSRGSMPSPAVVDDLEVITDSYRRLYHHLPSAQLVTPATTHLRTLTTVLGRGPDGGRTRVASMAGETAGLVAWLQHDLGDRSASRVAYQMSDGLLDQAGDRALSGYVTGFRALTQAGQGSHLLSRSSLDAATAKVGRAGPAMTVAWLSALRAQAAASMGDRVRAYALLRRAELALDRSEAGAQADWMYLFDAGRLAGYRGSVLLQLARPKDAATALGEAIEAAPPECLRRRADLHLTLAEARLGQGDPPEAVRLALLATDSFIRAGSASGISAVRLFHTRLRDGGHDTEASLLADRVRDHLSPRRH